ncbi:1308_t:CDS:1, partial [Gigaspora rosea]
DLLLIVIHAISLPIERMFKVMVFEEKYIDFSENLSNIRPLKSNTYVGNIEN